MLVIIETLQLTGIFTYEKVVHNIWFFIFSLVAVSILAIIGATFVGMYFARKIIYDQDFSPFEKEIIRMKVDLEEIKKTLKELNSTLERNSKNKTEMPGEIKK